MKNFKKIFTLLLLSSLLACQPKQGENTDLPKEGDDPCKRLEVLFSKVEGLEKSLKSADFSWEKVQPQLDQVLAELRFNREKGHNGCMFTDHKNKPGKTRFLFAEGLTNQIISHNIEAGINYLLDFQQVFKDDKEITEYFGEDLCEIALKNPALYFAYYNHNPEKKTSLIKSTRWLPHQAERLRANFEALPNGNEIVNKIQ